MLNIDDRLIKQTTPDEMYFLLLLASSIKHASQEKVVVSTSALCQMMGKSKPFVLSVKKSLIEKGLLSTKLLKSENNGFSASSYVIETPFIGVYLPAKGIEISVEKTRTLVNENDKGSNSKLQGLVNENDKGSNSKLQGLVNDVYPYSINSCSELTDKLTSSSAKISHEILQGQKNDFSSQGEKTKKEKKVAPKKEKKSEDPTSHLHKRFREIWSKFYLSKFQTEFVWGTTNAKGEYKASVHVFAIGSIAKQIYVKSVAAALGEITDARIENGFCFFISESYERADDFGKRNFTPNHLATKFNEYFTLIKSPKNATTQRTNGYDANSFRINPAMQVLNSIKSHQATTGSDTGLDEEGIRQFLATMDSEN